MDLNLPQQPKIIGYLISDGSTDEYTSRYIKTILITNTERLRQDVLDFARDTDTPIDQVVVNPVLESTYEFHPVDAKTTS